MSAKKTNPPAPGIASVIKTCATCKYYEDNRCHGFPPVIYRFHTEREFPFVKTDDWCGHFQPACARDLFARN